MDLSLVHPNLENASMAWNPFLKKAICALERVQHRAAWFRLPNYNRTASVTDKLKVTCAGNEKKGVEVNTYT